MAEYKAGSVSFAKVGSAGGRTTVTYSESENEDISFENSYMSGEYGAVPFIGDAEFLSGAGMVLNSTIYGRMVFMNSA